MKKLITITAIVLFSSGCMRHMHNNTNDAESYAGPYNSNKHAIKAKAFERKGEVTEAELEEYINRVGRRIVMITDDPDQKVNFKITKDQSANAFRENNNIYVSKGLLKKIDNEAELASFLSYMIVKDYDNITNHKARALSKDEKSVTYLENAGYDPKAASSLQKKLDNEESLKETYPVFEERIRSTEKKSEKRQPGLKVGEKEYKEMTNNI